MWTDTEVELLLNITQELIKREEMPLTPLVLSVVVE